jgi:hypothetical protein
MKRKIKIILLLLSIGLSSMQCIKKYEEPKPTLPAETQTGANTFGCLVNGEVWLPKSKSFISGISTTIQVNILNIGAMRGNESIGIKIRDLDQKGDYNLPSNTSTGYTKNEIEFIPTKGIITITKYDKSNQIISGRFWFNAENSNGEIIHVTDGRFDLNYTN